MRLPGRPWAILLYAGCAALILGPSSAAHAEPERIQLLYSAPASCPGQQNFAAEVRARTRGAFQSAQRASKRSFRIQVIQRENQYLGYLIQESPSGIARSNDIAWERCDELVSALAIKTALAIDGEAETPMPELAPRLRPPPPQPFLHSPATIPPYRLQRPPWTLGFGTQFSATGAISPGFAPAASFFVDWSRIGDGAEAFSVRLSILRAQNHVIVNQEIVTMEWIAGRLEGCPLHRRFERVTFVPCVALDAGTLEWTADPPGITRRWFSANLVSRVQLAVVGPLLAEAQVSLVVPFTRDRFGFGPQQSSGLAIHKVPILSASAGAGLALRFP